MDRRPFSSGFYLNCARQAGLRCLLFRSMQAVIFDTEGTNSRQRRMASALQTLRCSGVPDACAAEENTTSVTRIARCFKK